MPDIFALTTRGLEAVSAAEIAALPTVTLGEIAYRRISASTETLALPLGLRTVDDVYLDLGTWDGIGHTRDTLAALQWYATRLDLDTAALTLATLRTLPDVPQFSVTASFVGRRNFSSDEIKQTVSEGITSAYVWRYTADDRLADVNVRVFIEHERAFVGLRLGKHPLHERAYKTVERAGALKPTVAAAMLRLAGVAAGDSMLDPCCGSGTIPIEAAQIGAVAQGGDIDADAVAAAQANAQAAHVSTSICQWDARSLPLDAHSVDYVVTNLPWGKQIPLDEDLYRAVCREIERVAIRRVVTLTSTPAALHFERLEQIESLEISLYGQTPTISVYTVR